MKNNFKNSILLVLIVTIFWIIPAPSFGQEIIQRARETVSTTPRAADSNGASAGAAVAAPAATIAATPIPAPTPTQKPTATASPSPKPSKPVSSPAATLPQNDTAKNAENNNRILYTMLVALGIAGLGYGISQLFRQNTKQKNYDGNEKENQKCDSIKKLLDQKIKEMEESAKHWPKEKIEKTIKEYAVNKFLNEQEKTLLKQAESAKEKYDKLKEVVETLQKKFDLCKLELPNAENLKFVRAKITNEDLARYLEVEKTAIGFKTYSGIEDAEEAKEEIENNEVYFIIKNGELAGTTQYEIKGTKHAYLSGLVIIPHFRDQGIARKAAEFRLEKLKDMERIDLVTHPDNTKIINLYRSLGFKIESRKENYYGDGEPRLVMVLNK